MAVLMTDRSRFTSVFIMSVTISYMICGANSDLFGRRYFIVPGHAVVFVGAIIGGTSHSITQTIVAHVLLGFGSGNCQLAAFAIPELLPNKWRHIGVVIADGVTFFVVIAGPPTSRIAITHGENVSHSRSASAHRLIRGSGVGVTGPSPSPSSSVSSSWRPTISLQSTREASHGTRL